eukprot:9579944-Ditylum_brightwellii.AAC.1
MILDMETRIGHKEDKLQAMCQPKANLKVGGSTESSDNELLQYSSLMSAFGGGVIHGQEVQLPMTHQAMEWVQQMQM